MDEQRTDFEPTRGAGPRDDNAQPPADDWRANENGAPTRPAGPGAEDRPTGDEPGFVPPEPAAPAPGEAVPPQPGYTAGESIGPELNYVPSEPDPPEPGYVPPYETFDTRPGAEVPPEGTGPAPEGERAGGFPPSEPGTALPPPAFGGPTQDDRTLAALAHASIVLNLATGFGGLIAAALIWLVYRDRSKYVADQALQATVFQGVWLLSWAVLGAIWVGVGLLSAIVVGLCFIPFALILTLLPIVAFFYPFYAALQTYEGRDFKYAWIGNLVRGMA